MGEIEPRQTAGTSRSFDPLLKAAIWLVGVGLAALAVLAVLASTIPWEGFWRGAGQPYATTLAALAAISAAAIALHNSRSQLEELQNQRKLDQARYEEKREAEQAQREDELARWEDQRNREAIKELRSRFSEITTQLADANATVRRSGAYAMAALANDWRNIGEMPESKVCFGVLSAYLTTPNPTFTDSPKPEAGADGPVRALIVALLSSNAGPHMEDLWGKSSLLDGADLRGVAFTAPVSRVDFSDARLNGASFVNTKLGGTKFWGADLSEADFSFADLREGQLHFAKLVKADLYGTDLRKADLYGADFSNADLSHAQLSGAKFDSTDLSGADLSQTPLEGVDLTGVDYDDKTQWPEGYAPPPRRSSG